MEQRILSATERGVHALVLRPGLVYGYGGGIPGMLVHFAQQEGVSRTIGDGENAWSLIHRDDLADADLATSVFTDAVATRTALALSPDGRLLAAGTMFSGVAFCMQDENILISSSQDGGVKLWNIQAGTCFQTVRGEKPYEQMNVRRVTGLTNAVIATLKTLGAVEC